MNNNVNKDFSLYENGVLVAKAENMVLSVSETNKEFKLENISILPNFHLLNNDINLYEIRFQSKSGEVLVDYSINKCVFKNRSPVSKDYTYIEFIEGTFEGINANFDELLKSNV